MRRLVIAGVVALPTLVLGLQSLVPVCAQDIQMRPRSVWTGGSGPARETWGPGAAAEAERRNQAALQSWQRAEAASAATRVTPQNVLKSMKSQIEQEEFA